MRLKKRSGISEVMVPEMEDYRLIQTGHGRKQEQFGPYVLDRPDPLAQNQGNRNPPNCQGYYKGSDLQGVWELQTPLQPDQAWEISGAPFFDRCLLKLTSFKHVGIFPEQSWNWKTIADFIGNRRNVRVLNLFGYTGLASVVAAKAGANTITHVESLKQNLDWARENAELNQVQNIRWIREDAARFVQREVKRENRYDLIILDPPAFGRGPKGEIWKFDRHIDALLENIGRILAPRNAMVIFSVYVPGVTQEKLMHWNACLGHRMQMTCRHLVIASEKARLPAGFVIHSRRL